MFGESTLKDIHESLAADRIEAAVSACYRHAYHVKDVVNSAVFLLELNPNGKQVFRSLADRFPNLNSENWDFVLKYAVDRWREAHDLDFSFQDDEHLDPDDRATILKLAVGEIDAELEHLNNCIGDMTVPPALHPDEASRIAAQFARDKSLLRLRMSGIRTIKTRLKVRCLNYVTRCEVQEDAQRGNQRFLETVQSDVNNFFKTRSEDVYNKLLKAAQLSASTENEDAALIMTEVRRALKGAADYFYPPRETPVLCSDHKERLLGEEQYLNRLQQFISSSVPSSTARDLLDEELNYLASFTRRLNDLVSKGVHSNVTAAEAKQSLVGLYFFLFNATQFLLRVQP